MSHYYDSLRKCKVCNKIYDTWNDYKRDLKGYLYLCKECEEILNKNENNREEVLNKNENNIK